MATHKKPTAADLESVAAEQVSGKPTTADKGGESPTMQDKASDTPTMSDDVRQPPAPADSLELVQMTVRIDKRQRDRLQAMANDEGRLLSDVVREAIRGYLKAIDNA